MGEGEGRSQKMGLFGAISYIIGNIVGSGIFITPTSILVQVNSVGLSLIVWLLSACISILGSFCYVELGTSIRLSGADFAYICYVKWFPIAFAFMCVGCTITYPCTLAIQAQTFAEYIFKGFDLKFGETETYFAKKLLGFALIWILMFMNFFSLKTFVSRFQVAASVAKVVATGIVIVTGFYYLIFKGKTDNLEAPFSGTTLSAGSFVTALFAGLFSYDGWDILNFGAGEIENPKRTMPLAIIIGLAGVAIIYLAINVAYFVVLDVEQIKDSVAVAQDFATAVLGDFKYAIPFFVSVLLVGSLNSTMFSASRYLQAAAKQGHLPSFISGINPGSDSPRPALFVHILLSMAVSFAGDLDVLINYVAFAQWSQRAFTMAALIWIRFRHIPVHPDAISTPIVMPIIFFFICSGLVVVTIINDIKVAAVGMGCLLAGLILFLMFMFEKSLPSIEAYRKAASKANDNTTKFAQIVFNVMPELSNGEEEMDMTPDAEVEARKLNKIHPLSDSPLEMETDLKNRKKSATTISADSNDRY